MSDKTGVVFNAPIQNLRKRYVAKKPLVSTLSNKYNS